jgi:hypothetical protein
VNTRETWKLIKRPGDLLEHAWSIYIRDHDNMIEMLKLKYVQSLQIEWATMHARRPLFS